MCFSTDAIDIASMTDRPFVSATRFIKIQNLQKQL